MKKTILIIISLFCGISFSQSNDRDLGEFHKLQTYDLIKVNLIKSDANKISISGQFPKNVDVKNKNGELKIKMGIEKRFSGSETMVDLYYKEIYKIEAKEGSLIYSADSIIEQSLILKTESGGKINLKINTNDVSCYSKTGGELTVSGKTNYQDIYVNTGGNVRAKRLKTNTTSVDIKAGGVVDVFATNFLELNVKAGGEVNVHSNTKKIIEKKLLGGTINYLYKE